MNPCDKLSQMSQGPLSGWGCFSAIPCCQHLNVGIFLFFCFFLLAMHRCHSLVHAYNITLVIGMEMWAGDIISQTHTNFGTIDWVMTVKQILSKEKILIMSRMFVFCPLVLRRPVMYSLSLSLATLLFLPARPKSSQQLLITNPPS